MTTDANFIFKILGEIIEIHIEGVRASKCKVPLFKGNVESL